tara:strand:- start:9090 stop:10655 length:1566 start_codon:yes stop_codon:yes gene_type:complete
MAKKKHNSVERTKIKVKGGKDNQNQNVIQTVKVILEQPLSKPAKKSKKTKKSNDSNGSNGSNLSKKKKAIQELESEMKKFNDLKQQAQKGGVSLPASIGESSMVASDIKSTQDVIQLTEELRTKNSKIEEILKGGIRGQTSEVQAPQQPSSFAPQIVERAAQQIVQIPQAPQARPQAQPQAQPQPQAPQPQAQAPPAQPTQPTDADIEAELNKPTADEVAKQEEDAKKAKQAEVDEIAKQADILAKTKADALFEKQREESKKIEEDRTQEFADPSTIPPSNARPADYVQPGAVIVDKDAGDTTDFSLPAGDAGITVISKPEPDFVRVPESESDDIYKQIISGDIKGVGIGKSSTAEKLENIIMTKDSRVMSDATDIMAAFKQRLSLPYNMSDSSSINRMRDPLIQSYKTITGDNAVRFKSFDSMEYAGDVIFEKLEAWESQQIASRVKPPSNFPRIETKSREPSPDVVKAISKADVNKSSKKGFIHDVKAYFKNQRGGNSISSIDKDQAWEYIEALQQSLE